MSEYDMTCRVDDKLKALNQIIHSFFGDLILFSKEFISSNNCDNLVNFLFGTSICWLLKYRSDLGNLHLVSLRGGAVEHQHLIQMVGKPFFD